MSGPARNEVPQIRDDFPVPACLAARGISLRLQTEDDREMQRALFIQMRAPELAPLPWDEDSKRQFLVQQSELQQRHYAAHYQGAELYTVLEHGTPIGRLYVDRVSPKEIRLVDIIFFEHRRGHGFGTAFITALQKLAHESGRFVGLHVEENNPARQLYLRLGFKDVEPRPPYLYMTYAAD